MESITSESTLLHPSTSDGASTIVDRSVWGNILIHRLGVESRLSMGKLVLVRDCSFHGVVLAEALNIVTSRLNRMPKCCI